MKWREQEERKSERRKEGGKEGGKEGEKERGATGVLLGDTTV